MEFFWLICGAQEQVTRSAFHNSLVHSTIKSLISSIHPFCSTFHMSDSMHITQVALCAGVLSFLQAVAARPVVEGSIPETSTTATGQTTAPITGTGSGAVQTMGEVIANGNGTEVQTLSNTTQTVSPGTNWSLLYLGSSLPRL